MDIVLDIQRAYEYNQGNSVTYVLCDMYRRITLTDETAGGGAPLLFF